MSPRLKVGIAGYGVVGKRRRYFIDRHPSMDVVAVCDRMFDEGVEDVDGVPAFVNVDALLSVPMDALFVCLTNDVAPDVTIKGLQRGIHVFCEKPPGRTVNDIETVMRYEREHPRLKLKYGFNHRYHHSVQDALKILRSKELGAVINMRGVYGKSKFVSFGQNSDWRIDRAAAGGGILLDQGIHMVDLMRLFAGSDFLTVHSFVKNDFWKHDVEDNAYALMESETGIVAMLHSSATQWRHRFSLDVTLEFGSLTLSGILTGSKSYGQETLVIARADRNDDTGDPSEEMRTYDEDPSWAAEIDDFFDVITSDREVTDGSSESALETMRQIYRIYGADHIWRDRWALGAAHY